MVPICVLILVMSWDYVFNSWQRLEGSADAGGLPLLYLLKTLLLVMPVLLLIQGVTEVVRSALVLRGEAPLPRDGDQEGQGWN